MISVSELVEAQKACQSITPLKGSLGDGFLFSRNPIFRRLRVRSLHLGTVFTHEVGTFGYQTCANLALPEILKKKTVPYFKNAESLYKICKIAPNLEAVRILEIRRNNILHESAHLVANSILDQNVRMKVSQSNLNRFVLASLLSEAFASSCEVIGQVHIENEVHDWMYRKNTNGYGLDRAECRALLEAIVDSFGLATCLTLSIFSFLCWNFFHRSMSKEMLFTAFEYCKLPPRIKPRDQARILEFCNYHFFIHDWFRKEVAEFYFKSYGIKVPLAKLLNFDFDSFLKRDLRLRGQIRELIDFTVGAYDFSE